MTKLTFSGFALLALAVLLTAPASGQTGEPSRPADDGCKWEKLSDAKVGLSAWVERCDFGDRKIDLHFEGNTVVQKFSDGGDAEPVIYVFDLKDGEDWERGMDRIFAENTDPAIAGRCVPEDALVAPAGVYRYHYIPLEDYEAELAKSAIPDEVPEPPCGDFGYWPDGIQYFEVHNDARKILFVVAGQDTPLFDEQTLELLVP
ncbi:MAG: hypothetical protein ABI414_00780 [Devosia sp.]